MKKFTLISALMLFAVVAFAQRSVNMPKAKALPVQAKMANSIQGIERKATNHMRKVPRKVAELVTPPNNGEAWIVTGTLNVFNGQEFVNAANYNLTPETMQVVIDGNDIYIQGFAIYAPQGWVKGTIEGTTAKFASGQFVGIDSWDDEETGTHYDDEVYINGIGKNGPSDFEFTYDSEAGTLKLGYYYIMECGEPNSTATSSYWEDGLVLSKNAPEVGPIELEGELVTPPAGLEGEVWTAKGVEVQLVADDSGNMTPEFGETMYTISMKVIFDGNDVYIQGFGPFQGVTEAWVKGTREGNKVSFPSGQYLGYVLMGATPYHMYFNAFGTEGIGNIVFTLNEEENVMDNTEANWVITSAAPNSAANYYDIFLYTTITKSDPTGINAISKDKNAGTFYNLQGVKVNPTQKGIYIQNGRKMVIK